jgi:hypothetical protein
MASKINTANEAMVFCRSLFEKQIAIAHKQRVPPNTAAKGDAAARTAFLMLLSDAQQRELYLSIGSTPETWSRLRTLVGSPPYHFLKGTDANGLNAGGFGRGRVNMVYEKTNHAPTTAQFRAQLVDENEREYRVATPGAQPDDPLPGGSFFLTNPKMVLNVKLKRHSLQRKRELIHSSDRKRLFFPQVGEEINVKESQDFLATRRLGKPTEQRLRVLAVFPRGVRGSTASVVVKCV